MKTIGYLRLSKDDENDCESTSITNQRKIITNFANDKGIKIDDWYVDDGDSGYSQDRPMWQKLLTDLNNDIVGTVIAKDLSRLGRNNAQVQTFLDKMIEANKRVLTVSEGYDTFNRKTHSMTGVYTWMNHKYIEDISDKIRSSIEVMQKEGKWICSLPYGYMHDICNNHIFIEQREKDKMLEETVQEILKSPDYVSPTMIWKTIKSLGQHITYTRYRDLIFNKIFEINVLEPIGIKRGYRLAADKETLYSNLGLNIDTQYSTWCMTSNVTIDIILNISRFGSKIKYKSKKLLF